MASKTTDPASRGIANYGNALKMMNRSAFPLAVRGTLNALAFETRKNIVEKQMPKKFTIRNKFEQNAVRYKGSENTFDINKMASGAGQLQTVRFRKGPRSTRDLQEQELGRAVGPRPGRSMVRTPTIQARKGKSFNQPVARRNQPSTGEDWLSLGDIETIVGVGMPKKRMTKAARARRAHALVMKYKDRFKGSKYMLPGQNGKVLVFKLLRGKPVLLHVMKPGKKKLKKRETVKPAFQFILKTRADQIFREQADRRVKAHIKKSLRV